MTGVCVLLACLFATFCLAAVGHRQVRTRKVQAGGKNAQGSQNRVGHVCWRDVFYQRWRLLYLPLFGLQMDWRGDLLVIG